MRTFFDAQLNRILYRLNYIRPLDLRNLRGLDALDRARQAGRQWYLLEVPLADCRTSLGFAFSDPDHEPFSRTVRNYIEGKASNYQESPLKEYYDHFQPGNIWELLDLPGEAHADLLSLPPWAYVRPWENTSPRKRQQVRVIGRTRDNIRRGARLNFEQGGSGFGPVSDKKGELEFWVLTRLSDSIRNRGYRRHNWLDGDVIAAPLIDSATGQVRYLIRSGKHRTAVMAALGFAALTVRVGLHKEVWSEQAGIWPQVQSGLFTREQAEALFRRLFAGRAPRKAPPPQWTKGTVS